MTSIFARAMGSDFDRLHPMMQRRFGVGLDDDQACVGRGVMSEIRRGPWWTVPFLQFGKLRNILVPAVGEDVPFTIWNSPYLDPFGRETVTFVREYEVGGRSARFDATMILHDGRVIDYLGTHQHLAVDLDLKVDDGGLLLRSGEQRFYEGRSASGSRCSSAAAPPSANVSTTPTAGSTSTCGSTTTASVSSSATAAASPANGCRPPAPRPTSSRGATNPASDIARTRV